MNMSSLFALLSPQVTSTTGAKIAVSSTACSFWPYKPVSQLLVKMVEYGALNLQTNTPVTVVKQDSEGYSILSTKRGTLKAAKVVFATNAYTGGICSSYDSCIVPTKGTASHIKPKSGPVSPHLSHTYNISYPHPPGPFRTDYLNPRPDGGIVVGGAKGVYEQERAQWHDNWDGSTLLPQAKGHFDGLMHAISGAGKIVMQRWTTSGLGSWASLLTRCLTLARYWERKAGSTFWPASMVEETR